MRKEVLQATIAEIAKTACCAWEDYAKRNRGVDGPGLFAGLAKQDWANVQRHVNDGELQLARTALGRICTLERGEKQAWNARGAIAALSAYEYEADPC
jgi:hypothetical protein